MSRLRLLGIAVLLAAAAAVAFVALPRGARSAPATDTGTLTVTGTASATAIPDRASFDFTVETRARTAAEALDGNASAARAVSAAVKDAGVADADVRTAQVSLSPQTASNGRTVVGYLASNTITVTVRSLPRAGAVVDAAVGAGATGVDGPSLVASDTDALYRDALKAAVAQARGKADALAAAAGVAVHGVHSLVEGGAQQPVSLPDRAAVAPPVEPGTQQIQASVTVVYDVG